jgi:hypothetical protein
MMAGSILQRFFINGSGQTKLIAHFIPLQQGARCDPADLRHRRADLGA